MERSSFADLRPAVIDTLGRADIGSDEHEEQPESLSSIPTSIWEAVVTVATVGYRDMTPATEFGRVFGGLIMILGAVTFAMPESILDSGFASEMLRHNFLITEKQSRMSLFFLRLERRKFFLNYPPSAPLLVSPRISWSYITALPCISSCRAKSKSKLHQPPYA
jgi:hypothetical protein